MELEGIYENKESKILIALSSAIVVFSFLLFDVFFFVSFAFETHN